MNLREGDTVSGEFHAGGASGKVQGVVSRVTGNGFYLEGMLTQFHSENFTIEHIDFHRITKEWEIRRP